VSDFVWKIVITTGREQKKKYYEREEDFERWLKKHKKSYEPYGYIVCGFILKDNTWQDCP